MNLQNFEKVYFLGIGGIGMSALARWFKAQGYQVAGYDKTATFLTQSLQKEDITITFDEDPALIPQDFNAHNTLVVVTPAIPAEHLAWQYFKKNDFIILKRAEALGLVTQDNFTIAIAGTHGKTTTSSMLAHLLHFAQKPVTAFVGGITQNYATNLLLSKEKDAIIVVEADEYDRSFLTLHPDIAIITATDADHLDIYQSHKAVKESFEMFVKKIKEKGKLFIKSGLNIQINSPIEVKHFSLQQADVFAQNIRIQEDNFIFDVQTPKQYISSIRLGVPGYHNILNALAALAVAESLGISADIIKKGLESFRGVKRRFEYVLKTPSLIQIDDYAHHPEEIRAFLTAVRMLYPEKHITAIFQPHLYSRTRDFAQGFAETLSLADRLILLDIYPAREKPIEGVSSKMILQQVQTTEKILATKENLCQIIAALPSEVLVTIGAGDIDLLVQPIAETLKQKYQTH